MARRRYWNLKIGTSQCWGGVHWYGLLWLQDEDVKSAVRLEYEMTAEDVAAFIQYDGSYIPKVGSLSERFWTYEDALAIGRTEFSRVAEPGDELRLVEG